MVRRLGRQRERLRGAVLANAATSLALLAGLDKSGMEPDQAESAAMRLAHAALDAFSDLADKRDDRQAQELEPISAAARAVQQCLGLPGAPLLVSREEAAAALTRRVLPALPFL
jgi:hypothetical protein